MTEDISFLARDYTTLIIVGHISKKHSVFLQIHRVTKITSGQRNTSQSRLVNHVLLVHFMHKINNLTYLTFVGQFKCISISLESSKNVNNKHFRQVKYKANV